MRFFLAVAFCFGSFLSACKSTPVPGSRLVSEPGERTKVGLVYVVHGGFAKVTDQALWDSTIQMFSYDQNHPLYKFMIWNPAAWSGLLQAPVADKNAKKYRFEYERIGGIDPFPAIVNEQVNALKEALQPVAERHRLELVVDKAQWIGVDDEIVHLPYPRAIYHAPGSSQVICNYCGEAQAPWSGCNPDRYNVDGPFERLARSGVSRIYMIDMTVGGVRFSKTFDVYKMGQRALDAWARSNNKAPLSLLWINDPQDLMSKSYPAEPRGWTRSSGAPQKDLAVPLAGHPNPVAEDPALAAVNAEAIAAAFISEVPHQQTGVILLNHPINPFDEFYDPKIDDTEKLNQNIKSALLQKYRDLDPKLIVGAFMGIKERNPLNGLVEFTRSMRAEDLGHAYLYETDRQMPAGAWGYRYWDALQFLKDSGVRHIVIGFPQITIDSVLNLVEVPNQIAKEIGAKSWRPGPGEWRYFKNGATPFAEYWGVWTQSDCGGRKCCFKLGGCDDGRNYPAPRQTDMSKPIAEDDPALAFAVSEYGLLGFDPKLGAPSASHPVQHQYTGTWSMYAVPNNDPQMNAVLVQNIKAALARDFGGAADASL